ncbi:MAG: LapA family protein [bacterium]|nr:MAG: LapA family protein [bacterium]
MKFKTIVALILIALFLILLIQNIQVVTLRFLFWEITMSRIIFIPLILVIGFILGYIFAKTKKQK